MTRRYAPAASSSRPLLLENVAQVVVGVGVIGAKREGPPNQLQGSLSPALLVGEHAKEVEGIGVVRGNLENLAVEGLGLFQARALVEFYGQGQGLLEGQGLWRICSRHGFVLAHRGLMNSLGGRCPAVVWLRSGLLLFVRWAPPTHIPGHPCQAVLHRVVVDTTQCTAKSRSSRWVSSQNRCCHTVLSRW